MSNEGCPNCGETAVRPATRGEQLRHWFVNGGGGWLQVCAGCGSSSSSRAMLYRTVDRSWWALLTRLLHALRWARSWHPVPVFYAAVAAVGAAIVLLASVPASPLRSWRWVLFGAVGAVCVVFGLSLATALPGGEARRAVREVVAPRRAREEELERQAAQVRRDAAGAQPLVPAQWPGLVAIEWAAREFEPDGAEEVFSLAVVAEAGDRPGLPPWVRIVMERGPQPPQEELVATEVAANEPHEPPALDGLDPRRPQDRERMQATFDELAREQDERARDLASQWRDGVLVIDGAPVAARLLDGVGAQGALLEHDGASVTLLAAGIDLRDVAFEHATDLEPLLEDMRRRGAALFAG